ncbi:hypothetical protein ARMSODRAFT_963562 [Armillaria solidipes]|uniref:DUF6534 domain-containing protein n=1 Tax=Armillaria solidipes TaxID=1076256 RepID=A0A2H3BEL3_9AGAR|nr:hypothetical protein ARMSODRAFT_963562 [Armillaria solidipes]
MGSVQAADSALLLTYGFLAAFISGIITFQVLIDLRFVSWRSRYITITIWVLDIIHTTFILFSLSDYFFTYPDAEDIYDHIPLSIALNVAATAIQTLFVQCLFAKEIHRCSNRNWYITTPILVLSFIQLAAASVSAFEMIRLQHFPAFRQPYPSLIFVASLSISAVVDLLITGWLYYFLRSLQREIGLPSIPIRLLTRFTLFNGGITSTTIVVSLIFWVVIPTNLVYFIALYSVIGKLYVFLSFFPTRGLRMQIWEFSEKKNASGDLLILRSEEFYTPHQPWNGEFIYYPRENVRQLEVTVNETVEYGEHVRGIRNEHYSPYSATRPSPRLRLEGY